LEDLGSWRKQIAAGSTEIILPGARCVLACVCWKLSISSVAKRQWSELAHLFAIKFVVGLKNNAFACFSLVALTVSMGDTGMAEESASMILKWRWSDSHMPHDVTGSQCDVLFY
jgi:hypothetical protein